MWPNEWHQTLNDFEGHLPVAGLFKCNPSNIYAVFYQIQLTACSRGPSATAGLLVFFPSLILTAAHNFLATILRFLVVYVNRHNEDYYRKTPCDWLCGDDKAFVELL